MKTKLIVLAAAVIIIGAFIYHHTRVEPLETSMSAPVATTPLASSTPPVVSVPVPPVKTETTLKITALTPSTGPTQTSVTINGSGFDRNDNFIMFGASGGRVRIDGSADNVIEHASSTNGTTITFSIPTSGPSGILCDAQKKCVAISALRIVPGNYPVSVKNKNGTSNVLTFTVSQ